jgi:hypothetical protein
MIFSKYVLEKMQKQRELIMTDLKKHFYVYAKEYFSSKYEKLFTSF